MPDLTTHAVFAEQVLSLTKPALKAKLEARSKIFVFGAQGPDLFLFRKAGRDSLAAFGDRLHRTKIRETFLYMSQVLPIKKGMEQEVLAAYCLGYVCHYFLDRTVHPYAYAEEKRLSAVMPSSTPNELHVKIESEIDTALYQYYRKQPITSFSVREHMGLTQAEQWIISRFFSGLLKEVYRVDVSALEINRAVSDMLRISSLLYDPSGILYTTAAIAGSLIRPIRGSINHMKAKKVCRDVLNWQRTAWQNPAPPAQSSNLSVIDLFEQAKQEVLPIIEQIDKTGLFEFDTSLDFSGRYPE